jgi:ABC-type transport system involved in multi-copper enzyme maturation permease subunit
MNVLRGWVDSVSRRWRDPNPILLKELRTVFRSNLFVRFLYLSTALVAFVVLGLGALVASGGTPPASVGNFVFQAFFTVSLIVIGLAAPAYSAAALTSEKETGTYESLLLTGMAPSRIVWGKFLAAATSFALVLVAFAPVVGIAFLFGGISPWNVIVAYVGILFVLAVAVALGVALSAHLRSTRIAVLLALAVLVPVLFFGSMLFGALGAVIQSNWGGRGIGLFWFAEMLPARVDEPKVLFSLVGVPLYVVSVTTWFLLAAAVNGVRPSTDDRSRPFKMWASVSMLGWVAVVVGATALFGAKDVGTAGVVFAMCSGFVWLFYALLFANEPLLPRRRVAQRIEAAPALRRALSRAFGPGLLPTLRFAVLLLVSGPALLAGAVSAVRHIGFPAVDHARYDAALAGLTAGHVAVALALASFALWLRSRFGTGLAARLIALGGGALLTALPLLGQLVLDPGALGELGRRIPPLILVTPIAPVVGAAGVHEGQGAEHMRAVGPGAVLYAVGAVIFGGLVAMRVRRARGGGRTTAGQV